MKGRLVVLSGPSGVGKGSVIAVVRRRHPDVWLSVSVTTRDPRPGETEGLEYHFVDDAEFARMVAAGELLEHAVYAGHSYGTPRAPVLERLASGVPALLEIELQGARQVHARLPEAHLVFLAPPSFEELARRLTGRGTENPERVRRRLDIARIEMAAEDEFESVIVNDDVERAADALVALLSVRAEPGSEASP
ncbi:MAG TPA: guanylate kinase [Mycobacteriales bacterium]|nr:guanylate kinase [Mycobacteriales bacterium]